MLNNLSDFVFKFKKTTVIVWIALLSGLLALSGQIGSSYSDSLTLPDSESKVASTLLEGFQASAQKTSTSSSSSSSSSGSSSETMIQVVFASTKVALSEAQIAPALQAIAAVDHVTAIQSPFKLGAKAFSTDGLIATSNVALDVDRQLATVPIQNILAVADKYSSSSFSIEFLGNGVADAENPSSSTSSEVFGLGIAAIVLLLTFGSLVSALTPILIAIVALGCSTATIGLLSNYFEISNNGPILGALMGLSVGIDYALFIVTRFRKEITNGNDVATSLRLAMRTSGRAVLFAGIIVSFAVLGIFAVQISVLDGLAISAFVAVLISLAAAMTLLPALLSLLGSRINRLALPRLRKTGSSGEFGWWSRMATTVSKRPWLWMLSVSLVMLTLCVPALSIQLGQANSGSDAKGTTTKAAYDLLTEAFGDGYLTPLTAAVTLSSKSTVVDLNNLTKKVAEDEGVAAVTQATMDVGGELATFTIYPTTSGEDDLTNQLIARLRSVTIPEATDGTGLKAYIGGGTASYYDLASTVRDRLALFIGAVVAVSMVFLLFLFRSIAIPIKSALMNLLSVGAAIGAVTAVFQWGWGAELLGVAVGPIEPFVPILMFAILFGLSMDYEVFLVSKIQEDYLRTKDNRGSVRRGLQSSAGIITAAASIMVAVFLSFLLADMRIIQELATGLTVAIILDATLVRSILVPALMQLLGDRNWWLPKFLAKRLPTIKLEDEN